MRILFVFTRKVIPTAAILLPLVFQACTRRPSATKAGNHIRLGPPLRRWPLLVLPKGVIGAAPDISPYTQFGKKAYMKFSPFILASATVLTLALAMASCKPLSSPEVISQDCTVAAAPANFTRIFIGTPAHGGSQSGTSAKDPLDGTTAQKFDTILRSIAEGERPTWGTQKNIAPENLIVCLASGTFQTEGQYDTVFQFGYPTAVRRGFTVEKNWKIHGSGMSHTTLQLASFV